jgi:hypothetical protein
MTRLLGLSVIIPLVAGIAQANVVPNPDFEIVGSNGNPFTESVTNSTPESAAQSWFHWHPTPNSFIETQLISSTDPAGSGNMLVLTTNGGICCGGSTANGLFASLPVALPIGSHGSFDIFVPDGVSGDIGFVNSVSAFDTGSFAFSGTGGSWQTVSFTNLDSPTIEIGFEIFSFPAGALGSIAVDNAVAVPEPGTAALLLFGLGMGAVARARRAAGFRAARAEAVSTSP